MKCHVVPAGLLILCAMGYSAIAVSAGGSRAARVGWEPGLESGTQTLVIQFDGAPAPLEARVDGPLIEVTLDDATVADSALPEDVKAFRDGATTRLQVLRPGLVVRSVRVAGNTASIVVSGVAQEVSADSGYSVGVGDVLSVAVYKNPDLSGDFTVAPDGSITIPLVGVLRVAHRTELEISDELTKRLSATYLVDPQVSVSVKVHQSQFVYVTGAVLRSGRIAIRPGLTMRGALAEAEAALTPGTTVELKRASGETSILDAAALDAAGVPLTKDGDVLTVQQSNYVSIYGEVRRPNRLTLTPGMTLLQAIAMAEGLTDWASKKKVQILRKGLNGPEELSVNLGQVEKHTIPDPPLKPEDVIIVGRRVL